MRGVIFIYYFSLSPSRKIGSPAPPHENGKINYGATSISELMEGPLVADIPRSVCLARIGGRLLIEIDFGTRPVSSLTSSLSHLFLVVRPDGGEDVYIT